MMQFKKNIFAALLILLSANAFSYTQCQVDLKRVWTGDGGNVVLVFEEGGSAVILKDDPNVKNILSLSLAAIMGNKQVIVRYHSDGVSCTENGVADVRGVYLLK